MRLGRRMYEPSHAPAADPSFLPLECRNILDRPKREVERVGFYSHHTIGSDKGRGYLGRRMVLSVPTHREER